jgi:hypothetical protein
MKFGVAGLVLALSFVSVAAGAQTVKTRMPVPVPQTPKVAPAPSPEDQAALLRDDALKSNAAYDWVAELTTRFGARSAGGPNEKAAAEWAVAKLKALGFDDAHIETFPLQVWKRGPESLEITGPFPQKLMGVSLGGSSASPAGGTEAEASLFDTWQQFLDSKADQTGKIVVILQPMPRDSAGDGYGRMSGPIRWAGPVMAQKRGAVGFVMRSLSTDDHRFPHAGASDWSDNKGIPAMAISAPDADQLFRIEHMPGSGPVRLRINTQPQFLGAGTSQNVVAEIKGTEHPDQIVVVGGHLDSWDLGTGAIDDGVGTAIALGAAKSVIDHGLRPRRTIRLVLWGSEEVSQPDGFGTGGDNYAKLHATEAPNHVLAMEADFGADKVYRAQLPATDDATFAAKMAVLLNPLGAYINATPSTGGDSDTDQLHAQGVPCLLLDQDGYDYFNTHHTPDDVLERINRDNLNQVVAAWAGTLWMVAGTDVTFTRPAVQPAAK